MSLPALLNFVVAAGGLRLEFNVSDYDNQGKHHSNSTNFGAMFTKSVKMPYFALFWPKLGSDMARL